MVKALLDAKANVNAKNRYGKTALIKATNNGHAEIISLLKEYRAKNKFLGIFWLLSGKTRSLERMVVATSDRDAWGYRMKSKNMPFLPNTDVL